MPQRCRCSVSRRCGTQPMELLLDRVSASLGCISAPSHLSRCTALPGAARAEGVAARHLHPLHRRPDLRRRPAAAHPRLGRVHPARRHARRVRSLPRRRRSRWAARRVKRPAARVPRHGSPLSPRSRRLASYPRVRERAVARALVSPAPAPPPTSPQVTVAGGGTIKTLPRVEEAPAPARRGRTPPSWAATLHAARRE